MDRRRREGGRFTKGRRWRRRRGPVGGGKADLCMEETEKQEYRRKTLRITDRRRTWRRITELQEIKIWSKGGEEEQLSKAGKEEGSIRLIWEKWKSRGGGEELRKETASSSGVDKLRVK